MTRPGPGSITFLDVDADVALITRRAAATLKLRVVELPDGGFQVELTSAIDAYLLGDLTSKDPAWARLFLKHR